MVARCLTWLLAAALAAAACTDSSEPSGSSSVQQTGGSSSSIADVDATAPPDAMPSLCPPPIAAAPDPAGIEELNRLIADDAPGAELRRTARRAIGDDTYAGMWNSGGVWMVATAGDPEDLAGADVEPVQVEYSRTELNCWRDVLFERAPQVTEAQVTEAPADGLGGLVSIMSSTIDARANQLLVQTSADRIQRMDLTGIPADAYQLTEWG